MTFMRVGHPIVLLAIATGSGVQRTMAADPRFPIGDFEPVEPATPSIRAAAIANIAALPLQLRAAVAGLTAEQLDTPYRDGGWTIRQVVHHVADSHMNGFIRVKLALTEHNPTIKPYDEKLWAELADARLPIDVSLDLIDALHARWAAVYTAMAPDGFARTFFHPEAGITFTLDRHVQDYSWHGRHHVAHITALRQRRGWS
jgi:hypothetical protein